MAAWPSRDKVNFRLPWTNSCISAKLSRSKFFMLIVIHQQDALFRLAHVQAHLALETISHFRLIPHWKRPPCPGSSRIGQFSRKQTQLSDLPSDGPSWSWDGEFLFFESGFESGFESDQWVWRVRMRNRKVERITNLTNIRVAGWGWCAAAPNDSFITARDAEPARSMPSIGKRREARCPTEMANLQQTGQEAYPTATAACEGWRLLRLVKLQVAAVERIQLLLAQSRPHQPIGAMNQEAIGHPQAGGHCLNAPQGGRLTKEVRGGEGRRRESPAQARWPAPLETLILVFTDPLICNIIQIDPRGGGGYREADRPVPPEGGQRGARRRSRQVGRPHLGTRGQRHSRTPH